MSEMTRTQLFQIVHDVKCEKEREREEERGNREMPREEHRWIINKSKTHTE